MTRRIRDAILLLTIAANLHHLLVAICRWASARRAYKRHAFVLADLFDQP